MKCALCEERIGMFDESRDYPVAVEFNEVFQVRCHNRCWTEHVKRILKNRETELEVKAK